MLMNCHKGYGSRAQESHKGKQRKRKAEENGRKTEAFSLRSSLPFSVSDNPGIRLHYNVARDCSEEWRNPLQ
jgi:hypothetical protein